MPADDPVVTPAAPIASAPESPPAAEPPPALTEAPSPPPSETEPPKTETPPESAAPEAPPELRAHTETPTLLEQVTEAPKAEAGEPPQTETRQAYEPFTLPDGLALDQGRITEAANALFAQDNLPQERAQAYLDYHVAEMHRFSESVLQQQHDAFADMRAAERTKVMADPELGGNGHQTAMRSVAMMRDMLVSSAEPTSERYQQEMREFNDFLRITGAGDWLPFLRILNNAARKFQEPAPPPPIFRPPPDIGMRPNGAGSRRAAFYGTVDRTPRG